VSKKILQGLEDVLKLIIDSGKQELIRQGKSSGSGGLHDSLEFTARAELTQLVGEISFFKYGLFQDTGLRPDEIPFTPGGGRGGKSKYIQGIIEYVQNRIEPNLQKATGIAFGIATLQSRVGMPQRRGIFDKSRTGWWTNTLEKTDDSIVDVVQSAIFSNFEEITDKVFQKLEST